MSELMNSGYWFEVAGAACRHANIHPGAIEAIATWDQLHCANAVYRIGGGRYLKVYGPAAERQFHIERSVLRTLEGHPRIPAPRIVAEGERPPEPPYLVLSEVPGDTAEDVWDGLERGQQLLLAREFGEIIAAIHRLPREELARLEGRFGGWPEHTQAWMRRGIAEIEASETLTVGQREQLLRFVHEEMPVHLNGQARLTHYDMAWNHIYLAQRAGAWRVTGIIDWGEALLGPPEWDVAYLWFWTFSQDREAMREGLRALYADGPPPEQFARRCMAAVFLTSSMTLLWPEFAERRWASEDIVREMISFYFPAELFGPAD